MTTRTWKAEWVPPPIAPSQTIDHECAALHKPASSGGDHPLVLVSIFSLTRPSSIRDDDGGVDVAGAGDGSGDLDVVVVSSGRGGRVWWWPSSWVAGGGRGCERTFNGSWGCHCDRQETGGGGVAVAVVVDVDVDKWAWAWMHCLQLVTRRKLSLPITARVLQLDVQNL
ncbi:hypothetical protein PAXINDRAFT_17856 [Paxillus involutus ATCC 200175]|uniref:Unplaced genomic scaffold PAXINscaffold_192, whole genome shotgun sequence n=1 Tax=Paxillus involutus ATCC 200175 TaxID=664439 RepID=A0A0C9TPD7_PAXIN|nr:hypothetical protein PAXINDRAFT_17856 [Paxillus involutus ATCC 200175]